MLKLKKIAITGGLSCGKSSVCSFLSELGAYVVSADAIVHQLLSVETNLAQEIIKLLGTKILVDQKINRSVIAQMVFQDFNLLQQLEKILHPAVYSEIDKQHAEQEKKCPQPTLFVAEIPLLFESKHNSFDVIVVVVANEKICEERFTKKNSLATDHYQQRVSRQMPLSEKAKLANYVIINDGSYGDLKQQTLSLYKKLITN